ncbi:Lectin [Metarhizium acridum CQMa 102]|uniref:Lectin n=2 Tax=Metarhizium acridum TaxID=92637 RepID=E9EIL6_METAQ|nr:Lectin [Metarhizium acridum CQMa 102]EFY84236.1 Lectin [Metarhizium acridum CQMa 102]
MSYSITVRVYQTNTNTYFHPVERTVFRNGTWSETNTAYVLHMGASGTAGSLRFLADSGESFIVTLGVHNHKPWGDIVTKLDPASQTGVVITPEYYEAEWGGTQNKERVDVRWKTLSSYEVTRDGRKYSFNYTVTDGKDLKVNVVVG